MFQLLSRLSPCFLISDSNWLLHSWSSVSWFGFTAVWTNGPKLNKPPLLIPRTVFLKATWNQWTKLWVVCCGQLHPLAYVHANARPLSLLMSILAIFGISSSRTIINHHHLYIAIFWEPKSSLQTLWRREGATTHNMHRWGSSCGRSTQWTLQLPEPLQGNGSASFGIGVETWEEEVAGGKVRGRGWEGGRRLAGVTYHVVNHIQMVEKAADVSEVGEAKE